MPCPVRVRLLEFCCIYVLLQVVFRAGCRKYGFCCKQSGQQPTPFSPPHPQISFLSDMYASFSKCKSENAIPVYCHFVTCAPGTVPMYYSCCRPYLILKVYWFTTHDSTYFFYMFYIYIIVSFLVIQKTANVKHVTTFCLNVCY